jgi:hypothetical protein
MEDAGRFDARYLAFLETISQLRPQLHRYCSRMTGSITDGEDVVQDSLFRAYRSLDTYDDSRPLARRGCFASPTINASIFFGAVASEWRPKPSRRSLTSWRRTMCPALAWARPSSIWS